MKTKRPSKRLASVAKRLVQGARTRARKKQLPFDITEDDVVVPPFCPVLGLRLRPATGTAEDTSPTLDRIVPEDGYVPGNVVVVSRRANRLKSDASLDELRQIASFYDQMNMEER